MKVFKHKTLVNRKKERDGEREICRITNFFYKVGLYKTENVQ